MASSFEFTDRNLEGGFSITLESHQSNHANSKLTNKLNFPDFGNESHYKNEILKEMAVIYARLIYHYKFNYQTVFSRKFFKRDEDGQMLNEIELYIKLNNNWKFTESGIDKIDNMSPLENQIQK